MPAAVPRLAPRAADAARALHRTVLLGRGDRVRGGARPCALCRREDYRRFVAAWTELHGSPAGIDEIDERLHAERVDSASRGHRTHERQIDDLPDGAFVLFEGEPHLVLGPRLLRWTPAGYGRRRRRPSTRDVLVVTPPSLVEVLRGGWDGAVPLLHPSAGKG